MFKNNLGDIEVKSGNFEAKIVDGSGPVTVGGVPIAVRSFTIRWEVDGPVTIAAEYYPNKNTMLADPTAEPLT